LDDLIDAIAQAIRDQVAKGRSQGQLAVELGVARRMIGHIVSGERRIGGKTLLLILAADPPWLQSTLAEVPAPLRGSNGRSAEIGHVNLVSVRTCSDCKAGRLGKGKAGGSHAGGQGRRQ
jgi:transcriptional regulator with XRE-family HTH domain